MEICLTRYLSYSLRMQVGPAWEEIMGRYAFRRRNPNEGSDGRRVPAEDGQRTSERQKTKSRRELMVSDSCNYCEGAMGEGIAHGYEFTCQCTACGEVLHVFTSPRPRSRRLHVWEREARELKIPILELARRRALEQATSYPALQIPDAAPG